MSEIFQYCVVRIMSRGIKSIYVKKDSLFVLQPCLNGMTEVVWLKYVKSGKIFLKDFYFFLKSKDFF